MSIRYWEFEDAALKEKLKRPNVKEIARLFFENETEAYRFSYLLLETKKRGWLRLKDAPDSIPLATAKRYLDYAVQIGLLKHESNAYSLTDRYTKPFKNIAAYIKEWMESKEEEDLASEFANARLEKQLKRGGKRAPAIKDEGQASQPAEAGGEKDRAPGQG